VDESEGRRDAEEDGHRDEHEHESNTTSSQPTNHDAVVRRRAEGQASGDARRGEGGVVG